MDGGVAFNGRLRDVVPGFDPQRTPLLAEMRKAVLALSRNEPEDRHPGAGAVYPDVARFSDVVRTLSVREVREAAVMQLVSNGDRAGRAIPVLGQNEVRLAGSWVIPLKCVGPV